MCQFLCRTCCMWDGTVTVVGMHLRQHHPFPVSVRGLGELLWLEVYHPSPFPPYPIFVPSLPSCFFILMVFHFDGGLHRLGTPTYGPIHISWGDPQPMTYGPMVLPSGEGHKFFIEINTFVCGGRNHWKTNKNQRERERERERNTCMGCVYFSRSHCHVCMCIHTHSRPRTHKHGHTNNTHLSHVQTRTHTQWTTTVTYTHTRVLARTNTHTHNTHMSHAQTRTHTQCTVPVKVKGILHFFSIFLHVFFGKGCRNACIIIQKGENWKLGGVVITLDHPMYHRCVCVCDSVCEVFRDVCKLCVISKMCGKVKMCSKWKRARTFVCVCVCVCMWQSVREK
jgi:hypothetical protein